MTTAAFSAPPLPSSTLPQSLGPIRIRRGNELIYASFGEAGSLIREQLMIARELKQQLGVSICDTNLSRRQRKAFADSIRSLANPNVAGIRVRVEELIDSKTQVQAIEARLQRGEKIKAAIATEEAARAAGPALRKLLLDPRYKGQVELRLKGDKHALLGCMPGFAWKKAAAADTPRTGFMGWIRNAGAALTSAVCKAAASYVDNLIGDVQRFADGEQAHRLSKQ